MIDKNAKKANGLLNRIRLALNSNTFWSSEPIGRDYDIESLKKLANSPVLSVEAEEAKGLLKIIDEHISDAQKLRLMNHVILLHVYHNVPAGTAGFITGLIDQNQVQVRLHGQQEEKVVPRVLLKFVSDEELPIQDQPSEEKQPDPPPSENSVSQVEPPPAEKPNKHRGRPLGSKNKPSKEVIHPQQPLKEKGKRGRPRKQLDLLASGDSDFKPEQPGTGSEGASQRRHRGRPLGSKNKASQGGVHPQQPPKEKGKRGRPRKPEQPQTVSEKVVSKSKGRQDKTPGSKNQGGMLVVTAPKISKNGNLKRTKKVSETITNSGVFIVGFLCKVCYTGVEDIDSLRHPYIGQVAKVPTQGPNGNIVVTIVPWNEKTKMWRNEPEQISLYAAGVIEDSKGGFVHVPGLSIACLTQEERSQALLALQPFPFEPCDPLYLAQRCTNELTSFFSYLHRLCGSYLAQELYLNEREKTDFLEYLLTFVKVMPFNPNCFYRIIELLEHIATTDAVNGLRELIMGDKKIAALYGKEGSEHLQAAYARAKQKLIGTQPD